MTDLNNLTKEVVSKYKTPYFLFSKDRIREQYFKIKNIYPGIEVAYSIKTNPNALILEYLKSLGGNFSLCSLEEVLYLKKLGFNLSQIYFLEPGLTKKNVSKVLKSGIRNFIADSEEEIKNILSSAKRKGIKINLLIRIKTSVNASHYFDSNTYLGVNLEKALELLKEYRRNDLINKLGIHNHLISQNENLMWWRNNLEDVYRLIKAARENGILVDIVNFGGGFPVEYSNKVDLDAIIAMISKYIQIIKRENNNINFVLEPGRVLVAPSGVLITQVGLIKNDNIVFVNDSLYNSSMDTLIVKLDLPCYTLSKNIERKEYVIRGKTPCSLDIFKKKIELPKLKERDYVIFTKAGAYTFSSDFLNLKKAKIYLV